jgi:hypothetical protein
MRGTPHEKSRRISRRSDSLRGHFSRRENGGKNTVGLMKFTLWVFNIAIENGPFIDGLPSKNVDFPYVAMLNNHMVILNIINLKKIHHWITAFFPMP